MAISARSTVLRLALVMGLLLVCGPALASADEEVKNPAAGTPEAVVAAALTAALSADFDAYLATVHPDFKASAHQIEDRRLHEWTRFKRQVRWYTDEAGGGFTMEKKADEAAGFVRIQVRDRNHPRRSAPPIRLQRNGEAWGIVTNAL